VRRPVLLIIRLGLVDDLTARELREFDELLNESSTGSLNTTWHAWTKERLFGVPEEQEDWESDEE
jgi:hypothetical protein